jgi:hypothetical protein
VLSAASALMVALCISGCSSADHAPTAEACDKDSAMLKTAEESYFALNNKYGTYEQLAAAEFVGTPASARLHTITLSNDGASYMLAGTPDNSCQSHYP